MGPEHKHLWTHGPGKRGEKGRDGEHCQLANLTGTLEAGKVEYLSQSPLRLGMAI